MSSLLCMLEVFWQEADYNKLLVGGVTNVMRYEICD